MTEDEWLACIDPRLMLLDPQLPVKPGRLALLISACYLYAPGFFLATDDVRKALHLIERMENGEMKEADLFEMLYTEMGMKDRRSSVALEVPFPRWWYLVDEFRLACRESTARLLSHIALSARERANDRRAALKAPPGEEQRAAKHAWDIAERARIRECTMQCQLIRDVFGNPFRPVTLDPRWLTTKVIHLARTIYEERVWERMPILADALMDAGCDDETLINHCRSEGLHVRGCWLVDLLTARE